MLGVHYTQKTHLGLFLVLLVCARFLAPCSFLLAVTVFMLPYVNEALELQARHGEAGHGEAERLWGRHGTVVGMRSER